jgi:hypothetical protein
MKFHSYGIKDPSEGTCEWLFENPKFKKWVSQGRGIICIKGNPGAGKSTLMKYAQAKKLPAKASFDISFFFLDRGTENQKTSLGLFRSLLHQLLAQFPQALSDLAEAFKHKRSQMNVLEGKLSWNEQELRDFFGSCLAKILEQSAVRMFIDALDECGEDEARDLFKHFKRWDSKYASSHQGLSICFSCRHFPVVVPAGTCPEVLVEDENRQDIRKYIDEELSWTVQDLDLEDQEMLEDLRKRIESNSNGVFQWVALVVPKIFWMHETGKSPRQLLQTLEETPQELDNLYEKILQGLSSKEDSLKLFQWICFSRKPLSIPELRCAMNVDANHDYRSYEQWRALPKFIETDKQMEKQIRSLSGGLAELKAHVGMSDEDSADDNDDRKENQFVQFVHQSVKDFLISKGFCHFTNSELQKPNSSSTDIAIGRAHFELSRSCVRYISMKEILLSPSKARELAREFCLLRYATTNWISHAEAAEKEQMTQADLLQTFQWPSTPILHYWIDLCKQFDPFSRNTPRQSSTLLHIASKHGLFTLVEAILNSKDNWEVDIIAEDSEGNTALHWAIENGREDIVALLLIKGAKAEGLYISPVRKLSRCPSSRSLTSASLIVIGGK